MYRTCAFCNGKLDGDGGPSGPGVGRRLPFDEWKGRLWVICPKCSRCGSVLHLQAKHVAHARVVRQGQADVALILSCPSCRTEGAMLVGPDAHAALRQGLTYLALARGSRQRVEDAARLVERAGGPDQLISDVARRELTLRSLGVERRLALEMAVDERGGVAQLERHWREAEEIAEIADGTLSSDPLLEEELERIRKKLGRERDST